jgi:hypothetical protein
VAYIVTVIIHLIQDGVSELNPMWTMYTYGSSSIVPGQVMRTIYWLRYCYPYLPRYYRLVLAIYRLWQLDNILCLTAIQRILDKRVVVRNWVLWLRESRHPEDERKWRSGSNKVRSGPVSEVNGHLSPERAGMWTQVTRTEFRHQQMIRNEPGYLFEVVAQLFLTSFGKRLSLSPSTDKSENRSGWLQFRSGVARRPCDHRDR